MFCPLDGAVYQYYTILQSDSILLKWRAPLKAKIQHHGQQHMDSCPRMVVMVQYMSCFFFFLIIITNRFTHTLGFLAHTQNFVQEQLKGSSKSQLESVQ